MANVLFHPEAQAEYQTARDWYRARSLQAANRFDAEIERVLGLIVSNPDFFPKYDDEHRFAVLRRFPFSLVYQIQPSYIYIIAVAHSSRSVGYWQGRV